MVDPFPPISVKRDPEGLALVVEVTLPQISSWLMHQFEDLPEHLLQHIRDLDLLKKALAPLYDEMADGDSLWLCRGRPTGPHADEGVALVREGRPILYMRMVSH
ncbi:hypothetical protein [Pleomorphomonas oryzae]|uniref:hypothetical protein n=1 Tax=Pleomorphomonas oryzae TaxID=261934 RepID=UPI00041D0F8E|nr:hypothetical protein [Pleomorphomonas oryzae]